MIDDLAATLAGPRYAVSGARPTFRASNGSGT